jgi:hypothetical protein
MGSGASLAWSASLALVIGRSSTSKTGDASLCREPMAGCLRAGSANASMHDVHSPLLAGASAP